jgi:HTH-type transcriptional regulator / antitoxin HigA
MAKTIRNQFHPDLVFPPGDTIKESLEALGMKQSEFARRMGVTEKYVIDLLGGAAPLSADTALKLERVFNVPARFWTNLELSYREYLARQKEVGLLTASVEWARQFPLKELAALRWVERDDDELTNAHRLLTFFGCASEKQWQDVWGNAAAVFRHSAALGSDWHAVTAWLRRGQMEARERRLPDHDVAAWEKSLAIIRANISPEPRVFQDLMVAECAQAGVGLLFLPALPKMAVSGACVWQSQNPCIYLSLRYKTDDQLWFSFFHEAMHVRQNIRKRLFVDEPRQAVDDPQEEAANKYAAETLIPRRVYEDFVNAARFDSWSVRAFAKELSVTPGIVVGRLQHDQHVPWASRLNQLKQHYTWTPA